MCNFYTRLIINKLILKKIYIFQRIVCKLVRKLCESTLRCFSDIKNINRCVSFKQLDNRYRWIFVIKSVLVWFPCVWQLFLSSWKEGVQCLETIPSPGYTPQTTKTSTNALIRQQISALPVLVRDGIVPRQRARLRRPGREEGEALRSRGPCWRLMSLERLGGGVGMKESARSGLWKGGTAVLPARYLQHKSNAIV